MKYQGKTITKESGVSVYSLPGCLNYNNHVTFEIIENIVLDYFESNNEEARETLKTKTRKGHWVAIRMMVFYFAHEYLPHMKIAVIASKYNRDHAIVCYSKKRVDEICQVEPKFRRLVAIINQEIKSYINPINEDNEFEIKKRTRQSKARELNLEKGRNRTANQKADPGSIKERLRKLALLRTRKNGKFTKDKTEK